MAGCSIIIILFIIMPIFLIACLALLGTIGGSLLTVVFSALLLIILQRKGVFEKYRNSEESWKRILAVVGKWLLIFLLIGSTILLICGIFLVFGVMNH